MSVPELGYNAEQNEGEICLRGAGIMTGYFDEPELTKQAIDENVRKWWIGILIVFCLGLAFHW